MLCFDESVDDAKNVVKTNTTGVNAFTSPNTGASDAAMNAFINNNASGIIIAGTGNGSFDKAILESVKNAVAKGIKVVR